MSDKSQIASPSGEGARTDLTQSHEKEERKEDISMGEIARMKERKGQVLHEPLTIEGVGPVMVRGREYSRKRISEETGIELPHVSRIFSGRRKANLQTALKLARYFEISVEELVSVVIPVNVSKRIQADRKMKAKGYRPQPTGPQTNKKLRSLGIDLSQVSRDSDTQISEVA